MFWVKNVKLFLLYSGTRALKSTTSTTTTQVDIISIRLKTFSSVVVSAWFGVRVFVYWTITITSLQPLKLHRDIGYVPPTDTGSLCLAVDSTHTVVGLFRLLIRRSGTHCQMNSEIRRVMLTASNSSLKQSCSALTSVTSALEVIFNVMRSINPRFTYLLTYPRPRPRTYKKSKAKAKDLGSRSRSRTQKVQDKTKDIKQPLPQHTLPYHKEYSMCAKWSMFNMQLI